MQRVLSTTESRIIGYLIGAQGTPEVGSTIAEIVASTGLSQNTVYTAIRKGIPGVLLCKYPVLTGAKQYFVTPQSLKDADLAPVGGVSTGPITYKDLAIYDNEPDILEGLEATISKTPPSTERIMELVKALEGATDIRQYVVAGQAIAVIGMALRKGTNT